MNSPDPAGVTVFTYMRLARKRLFSTGVSAMAVLLFFPAIQADAAGPGPELYHDNCAQCHGQEGEGARAPALNKQGLLVTVSTDYIRKSILHGRTARRCPSFKDRLSGTEIEEITRFITGWRRAPILSAPEYDVAASYTPGGRQIYVLCGGCHGVNEEGAMAPFLLDWGFLASVSDTDLRRTIMWGRPGTPMKGYQKGQGGLDALTPEEIDSVISYIRYRQKNPTSSR